MNKTSSPLEMKSVVVTKQTINDLLEDNKFFVEWLNTVYGFDAVESFVSYLKTELSFVPRSGTKIDFPFVGVGVGSLSFFPYTTSVMFGRIKDPINLIFYRQGSAKNVENEMLNTVSPNWHDVWHSTSIQYTFIDDSKHSNHPYYQIPQRVRMSRAFADTSSPQGLITGRKHIRIFESPTGCTHSPGFGEYSLASVHEDTWKSHIPGIGVPGIGIPVDFDNAQLYVETAFSTLGKAITHKVLQPQQIINTVQHDGIATAIEI